ncbi:MAG: hypothetical protein HDR05_05000 [Lachnospiraceae bacterium]|nr:hypothetical protein [Lachnospiraceae bacterium]
MKRICKQCGAEFTLTQDEVAFYQSKNLHIPKRCEKCRMENRAGGKTGTGMRPVSSGKNLAGNDYESVKTPGQVVRAYDAGKNNKKKVWIAAAAVLLLLAVGVAGFQLKPLLGGNGAAAEVQPVQAVVDDVQAAVDVEDAASGQEFVEEPIEEISTEQPPEADIQPEVATDSALPEEEEIQKPQTADAVSDTVQEPDEAAEQATVSEAEQAPAVTYHFRKAEYLQEHFEKHGAEFGYATAEEYLSGANRVITSPGVLHKQEAEDGDDVYYLEATNEIVFVSTSGYLRTYFKPNDGKAYYDRQ